MKQGSWVQVEKSLTLAHVAQAAARPPQHGVACVQGQWMAHAQWVRMVQAWRAAFAEVPGPDVALYFDDAVAFSAALWGAWHAGKTPVLASDAQAHTLQCLMPAVQACAGDLPGALHPCWEGEAQWQSLSPLDLQACHVVLFTSGSTGQPERIVKKLRQLDAEVHALQAAFADEGSATWNVVSTVSHQHIYGLLFRVLWPLSAGRPMGAALLRFPEEVLQVLSENHACVLVSSPAFLGRLPAHLAWQSVQTHVQRVFSSGGPLAAAASAQCLQLLGHSPTEVFGSSETGGIAWRQRAEHGDTWQLLPGVQVRVEQGGALAVCSPHLADATQWCSTADRATVSDDGHSFALQGRADRVVKIAEKRVSLTGMEQALQALDWAQMAKTVVLESPGALARIGVVLELSEAGWQHLRQHGRRAMAAALRQHLSAYVEHVALPRSWRYVVRMPVNAQSKTTQYALQQLFNPSIPQPDWIERTANRAVAALYVDAGLRVLEGHFPQASLVAGVAQLQWVTHLGQQAFGLEPRFSRVEVLKFQQPILPGDTVQVELAWDVVLQRLQFALTSPRGPHASGRLLQGLQ